MARPRSLRARVRNAIALVTTVALLLFGIPLAVVLDRLITTQALTSLQRDATRAVAVVPDNMLEAGTPVPVPRGTGDIRIAIYDAHGTRVGGVGPPASALATRAVDGREHDGSDGDDLGVVMPVLSDTTVAGSVRAAVPLSRLHAQVYRAWALLAALALLVVAVATLLASRAAGRISRPFEQLTAATRQIAGGRYDVHLPQWGIPEADAAGDALRDSAREIDTLVRHERAFVRDASHQLRTPLAGVLLFLQRQPPDVASAIARAHDLETTIADLLSLRSPTAGGSCDPALIAGEAVRRWNTPQRPVVLRTDHTDDVGITGPALRQSLDVLLDNALRHGGGTVTVTVEPFGETVLVEVADQGTGFRDDSAPGTGLQLVTNLMERANGSLMIRRRAPRARVALLLPPAGGDGQSSSSNR